MSLIAGVVRVLAYRRERLVARLLTEARMDPLTGLLNRRGLGERLDVELQRARRDGATVAAIAIDVDHFKAVNDTHGHEAGDHVLHWVADTIRSETRASDRRRVSVSRFSPK